MTLGIHPNLRNRIDSYFAGEQALRIDCERWFLDELSQLVGCKIRSITVEAWSSEDSGSVFHLLDVESPNPIDADDVLEALFPSAPPESREGLFDELRWTDTPFRSAVEAIHYWADLFGDRNGHYMIDGQ